MGQGPHSHDMLARADLGDLHPAALRAGRRAVRGGSVRRRRAAPVLSSRQPQARARRGPRARAIVFNVGIEPEFFLVVKNADGSIRGWDPHGVDDLAKPCYDYKGISGALGFLRALNDGLDRLGWGVYQSDHEDANFQYEVNFRYADALDDGRPPDLLPDDGRPARPAVGAIATFMAKPFSTRTGSGAHMHYHLADAVERREPVSRRVATRAAWASRRWPITSSAACSSMPRPSARSRRRRSTATSGCRWARR